MKTKAKAKKVKCEGQSPICSGSLVRQCSVNGSEKEGKTFALCGACRVYLGRTAKLVEAKA